MRFRIREQQLSATSSEIVDGVAKWRHPWAQGSASPISRYAISSSDKNECHGLRRFIRI
jgi:hypothetical protein